MDATAVVVFQKSASYPEHGRIENEEVIEEHNKFVEKLRNEKRIVSPPNEKEMLRILKELKHIYFNLTKLHL